MKGNTSFMRGKAGRNQAILERVKKGRLKKAQAALRLGISRKTLYEWLKRYEADPSLFLAEGRKKKDFKKDLLKVLVANPGFGPERLALELGKRGRKVSPKAVWLCLRKLDLNTRGKREAFCLDYKPLAKPGDASFPGHLRQVPETRKRMIEEVLIGGKSVTEVCREYHLSRKNFYKWLGRYQEAKKEGKVILKALEDNNAKGFDHPRAVSKETVKEILKVVRRHPEYSTHQIAERLANVGNRGVQNAFTRLELNTYEKRAAYSQTKVQQRIVGFFGDLLGGLRKLLGELPLISALPPPQALLRNLFEPLKPVLLPFILSLFSSFFFMNLLVVWFFNFRKAVDLGQRMGFALATISLMVGLIFFTYSLRYYLTLALVLSFTRESGEKEEKEGSKKEAGGFLGLLGKIFGVTLIIKHYREKKVAEEKGLVSLERGRAVGMKYDLSGIRLRRRPFVSVHLPMFNEERVVERLLKACARMEYFTLNQKRANFEVMVIDDSTDKTTQIAEDFAREWNASHKAGPKIKVLHRPSREGFKGGALEYALKRMNPKAEFVVVFDADFVPYPDTLELFLKYFKTYNPLGEGFSEDYTRSKVAAVGGYQWHVLNKSENWITRGVRTEYAGSYVIERAGREIMGFLKQISGSVYMIRTDVLKKIGWGTSITEDFQLTLRLYEQGYKVVYTPYIQAPAECVSGLRTLVRQRMRWAEGHSNNVRKMFGRLMFGRWARGLKRKEFTASPLTVGEKIELLYISPYYLQAFFFLMGTVAWIAAEVVFRARLPFWTALWGWSLVLTNFLALPLMNAVGLFLEEAEERDYLGLASFVFLSYLLVPFQAYASVKGFLRKEEGPWFRTPKTGRITDVFRRGTFYRWMTGIFPGWSGSGLAASLAAWPEMAVLGRESAVLRENFGVRPRRMRWFSKAFLAVLLIISSTLFSLTKGVPEALASQYTAHYLDPASLALTPAGETLDFASPGGASCSSKGLDKNTGSVYWYTQQLPTDSYDGSVVEGDWSFVMYFSGLVGTVDFNIEAALCDETGCSASKTTIAGPSSYSCTGGLCNGSSSPATLSIGSASSQTFTAADPKRVAFILTVTSSTNPAQNNVTLNYNYSTCESRVTHPTLTVPENLVFLMAAGPLVPMVVFWLRRKKDLAKELVRV